MLLLVFILRLEAQATSVCCGALPRSPTPQAFKNTSTALPYHAKPEEPGPGLPSSELMPTSMQLKLKGFYLDGKCLLSPLS